jgi:hypothetical protein
MGYSGYRNETGQARPRPEQRTIDISIATEALHTLESNLNGLLSRIENRTSAVLVEYEELDTFSKSWDVPDD